MNSNSLSSQSRQNNGPKPLTMAQKRIILHTFGVQVIPKETRIPPSMPKCLSSQAFWGLARLLLSQAMRFQASWLHLGGLRGDLRFRVLGFRKFRGLWGFKV